jgi:hypothetical protein
MKYSASITVGEHDLSYPEGTNTLQMLEIHRDIDKIQDTVTIWIDQQRIKLTFEEFQSIVREIM